MTQTETPTLIFPPVDVLGDDDCWYSVQVTLPAEMNAKIQAYVEQDAPSSWTLVIHGALYDYRASIWTREQLTAELDEMLMAGLQDVDASRTTEATPEFMEDLLKRAQTNYEHIKTLQAEGRLGNLLLPEALYDFLVGKVRSGEFRDPAAVVCAAMPFLKRPQSTFAT